MLSKTYEFRNIELTRKFERRLFSLTSDVQKGSCGTFYTREYAFENAGDSLGSYNIAKEVHFSTLFRVEVQAVKRPHQRNPRSPGRTPSRIRETCACVRRVRVTNMSSALPRFAYLGFAKLRSET